MTKSMIITAAMDKGYFWTWVILLFAGAGVFHHAGIKLPYFAFFAHDSGKRCEEAPRNMLVAMAISAALCIGIGTFPDLFYRLLPYKAEYHPYSLDHVVAQLQLLLWSALAFALLMRTGIYPPELRSTNLDVDWLYRRAGRQLVDEFYAKATSVWLATSGAVAAAGCWIAALASRHHGPNGVFGRTWPTGTMALWTTLMLGAWLLLSYR